MITEWKLRGKDYTNKVLTSVEKIVILELPKFKKYKDKTQNQELKNWVEFITNPEKELKGERRKDGYFYNSKNNWINYGRD